MTRRLSELTTMQVGGAPAELLEAHNRDQLIDYATGVWSTGDDWLVLGGGSNIVAADDLSHLTVIRTLNRGIERNGNLLRVQAGENWDEFVAFTVAAGLSGVEALSGIPGCVGAAPVQNIGAYGQEVADTIARVEFVEYPSGDIHVLESHELGFGYRDSVFKRGRLGVITWVEFELSDQPPASLERLTQVIGREVTNSADIRREVLATRASKGMVLDSADPDTASCGSFFMNPIVSDGFSRSIPGDAPRWLQVDGSVKLSAAWLIENSGLGKGFRLGNSRAALSTKHALAITNRGNATAEEVRELASFIQLQVANRWGINLVPEPNFVGF
ncbi:MAG: UDP-N-acetylmuramate dehydrogenase [Micrococcales bacterium]